jgi:copper chaperone
MITFLVSDMSCGHCVGTITQAVKDVDPDAEVRTDLSKHLVEIQPRSCDAEQLRTAIERAGYTPVVQ